MTYENSSSDLYLLTDFLDELAIEETFMIPPAVDGMRPLDYEPDVDDFEYLQSLV